ncbi:MAG: FapA family protein [Clostridiales bacterium]|jgi:uncharacterized protein (DUF342 family)|nr:FapA family protein [Clostridiales bacterium]
MAEIGSLIDTSYLKLYIGRDKMSVFLTVSIPPEGRVVRREDIDALLEQNNIVYGLKAAELDALVKEPVYNEDVLIAEGTPADHGKDGWVEYLIEFAEDVAPKVMQDGRVDYHDMNIVHPVKKGDELCRVHPPTQGQEGRTVLGAALAAKPGRPAPTPRGRNVQPGPDGASLVAALDGQLKRNGPNMDVLQEFEVQKDVDFSTGNIHFPGSVTVRGNVLSGFVIQSGGDVTINGLVEKANITAAGNIILHGGMTGQGGGVLRAGGDIFAKYVENSLISASGKITAECIMHSTVRAGIGVELIGKKGLLVGGSAKAHEYVKAVTIGSQFATITEIEVGSDPKLNDRLKDLKAEIQTIESEIKKVQQALAMFKKLETAGALTPEKALIFDRTRQIHDEHSERLGKLREEHDSIEQKVKESVRGFIRASGTIFVGVKVSIANNNLVLKEDVKYCTLKSDGDDIRVAPF